MEIKKIRESRRMLQYELANRMGVKQASVSAWESGKTMPSAENLLKLADILENRPTWSLFLITTDKKLEESLGRKADRRRKLYNGRLETQYYQFHSARPG